MIMKRRAPREALTRSLLTDGHFRSVAGALKSIRVSDMRLLKRRTWRRASRRSRRLAGGGVVAVAMWLAV
jgi:hypothetical protein